MDDSCFVRVGEIKINLFPLCLGTINNRLGNSSNSFLLRKSCQLHLVFANFSKYEHELFQNNVEIKRPSNDPGTKCAFFLPRLYEKCNKFQRSL